MNEILFVCTANRLRSKTAADCLRQLANNDSHLSGYSFESCGTDTEFIREWNDRHPVKEHLTPISERLVRKADIIYCMEPEHAAEVRKFSPRGRIAILNLPDIYDYMDPRLIAYFEKLIHRSVCDGCTEFPRDQWGDIDYSIYCNAVGDGRISARQAERNIEKKYCEWFRQEMQQEK